MISGASTWTPWSRPSRPAEHAPLGRAALAGLVLGALILYSGGLSSKPRPVVESRTVQAVNLELPNWMGDDYAPWISPDGRYLIFQSDRPGSKDGVNLWFSINKRSADRLGPADWTVPLPLFFPMEGRPTKTMRITGGRYTLPESGAYSVNTDGFEGMPAVYYAHDKDPEKKQPMELYFTSMARVGSQSVDAGEGHGGVDLDRRERDGQARLNIYVAKYQDDRWLPPEPLTVINSHFNDRMPALSPDGRRLYFVSDRPGGYGGNDIWVSTRDPKSGRWSDPRNMGPAINTEYSETAPGVSPGGGILFFSSNRPGGFGHYDLYHSRFDGYVWGKAVNLGAPFNTSRDEEYFSITEEGHWAYFASDRRDLNARGRFDIYRVRLPEWLRESFNILLRGLVLDGRSGLPLGVEATIKIHYPKQTLVIRSTIFQKTPGENASNFQAELPSGRVYIAEISAPGFESAKLRLDYRGNVYGGGRIDYRVIELQPIKETKTDEPVDARQTLRGRVIELRSRRGIAGAYIDVIVNGEPWEAIRADDQGNFVLKVPPGAKLRLTGRAADYRPNTVDFTESKDLTQPMLIPLAKDPCDTNDPACIDRTRILFAVDEAVIRPSEASKLDQIVRIMNENPELRIRIVGHADKQGDFEYNQGLSERRSAAVRGALIQAGIKADRLVVVGRSESIPVCRDDTPECYARNRRVEFERIIRERNP